METRSIFIIVRNVYGWALRNNQDAVVKSYFSLGSSVSCIVAAYVHLIIEPGCQYFSLYPSPGISFLSFSQYWLHTRFFLSINATRIISTGLTSVFCKLVGHVGSNKDYFTKCVTYSTTFFQFFEHHMIVF
jgi:hypothetical protein